MKRELVLLLVAFAVSVLPLQAEQITFTATLDGLSEAPPTASSGTGFATVTIDDILHTMRVQVTFEDLIAGTTAAHIHVINGPGDSNTADTVGPVTTTTPAFTNFPLGVTAGTYDFTFDMTLAGSYRAGWITDSGGTTALAEDALFTGIDDGRAYLNIHSSTFPGGEIRGFLQPVPEPASLLLLGSGLVGVVLRRRHRRR